MKREKWMKWEPIAEIPQTSLLVNVEYSEGLLTLYLQDQVDELLPMLKISFHGLLAMRITDEGNLLKDTCDVDETLMTIKRKPGYYYRWTLFTVDNSHFIEWFYKQVTSEYRKTDIVHFVVKTPDEIVEVLNLTASKPILSWNK